MQHHNDFTLFNSSKSVIFRIYCAIVERAFFLHLQIPWLVLRFDYSKSTCEHAFVDDAVSGDEDRITLQYTTILRNLKDVTRHEVIRIYVDVLYIELYKVNLR